MNFFSLFEFALCTWPACLFLILTPPSSRHLSSLVQTRETLLYYSYIYIYKKKKKNTRLALRWNSIPSQKFFTFLFVVRASIFSEKKKVLRGSGRYILYFRRKKKKRKKEREREREIRWFESDEYRGKQDVTRDRISHISFHPRNESSKKRKKKKEKKR